MFDPTEIDRISQMRKNWEGNELSQFSKRQSESRTEYRTASGLPLKRFYTPEDISETQFDDIGFPAGFLSFGVPIQLCTADAIGPCVKSRVLALAPTPMKDFAICSRRDRQVCRSILICRH